jgi:hypothetical protein
MSRDDILRFGLDAAKEEYLRGQSRLGLVETKAQLLSGTAGVLLTLIATLGPDHISISDAIQALLLMGSVGTLLISLILSLAASFLVDVYPPQSAAEICARCEELIKSPGDTTANVDPASAEVLVGNTCGSYLRASREVASLLQTRMRKLKAAQITLAVGLAVLLMLIGPPYLASARKLLTICGC